MVLKMGNLPINKKVIMKFTYIEELDVSVDKFWRICLPGALRSRYVPLGSTGIPSNKLSGT
jgi:hypothetical protein